MRSIEGQIAGRRAYFGVVNIGRLAILSSCAVGFFFFGFLISAFLASLLPIQIVCHEARKFSRACEQGAI
jgi:hypothetical protein